MGNTAILEQVAQRWTHNGGGSLPVRLDRTVNVVAFPKELGKAETLVCKLPQHGRAPMRFRSTPWSWHAGAVF